MLSKKLKQLTLKYLELTYGDRKMTKTTSKRYQSTIKNLFREIGTVFWDSMILPEGENKVYEIFCVYKLLKYLKKRYSIKIYYRGKSKMVIRQGGARGKINKGKYAYFEITNDDRSIRLEIHMNVYFRTLGSHLKKNKFRLKKMKDVWREFPSHYHELDIILIENGKDNTMPRYDDIILGIECKHHSTMDKRVIREILGVRRELSFFHSSGIPSRLDCIFNHKNSHKINAYPSSILWLAHRNKKISNYKTSPRVFGVEMKNWKLPWDTS